MPCRERRQISSFLQYRPQPLGAAYNLDRDPLAHALRQGGASEPNLLEIYRGEEIDARYPVIRTGRELARWFESETPGHGHRHALNLLLRDANWSPPRQAWVWAALDITIYSALLAAWYYKWSAGIDEKSVARVPTVRGRACLTARGRSSTILALVSTLTMKSAAMVMAMGDAA